MLELPAPRIVAELTLEQLDGDAAFQPGILGQIHLAHAALAQQREDAAIAQQVIRLEFAVADRARRWLAADEREHLGPQRLVVPAGVRQERSALVLRPFEGERHQFQQAIRFVGWHSGFGTGAERSSPAA